MERGQATVETAALWGLVALLLLIVAVLLGPGLAGTIVAARSARGAPPRCAPQSRSTPDERALRNPRLRALIDRALPRLVLERDATGDDDEVPVWTRCRHPACARAGRAEPVLHVHVVHAASGPVVELWTYYPDSQTSHLPLAALRGYHHDDWEGLMVAFARDGSLRGARASAHSGFNGTAPWWEQAADDWAPYGGVVYRASGSHALGFRARDLDLAGDAWNGDLATVEPGRSGSWRPTAWRCAASASTPRSRRPGRRPPGATPARATRAPPAPGPSRVAKAARVWAQAYALGAW